jgi:hypothetical protein
VNVSLVVPRPGGDEVVVEHRPGVRVEFPQPVGAEPVAQEQARAVEREAAGRRRDEDRLRGANRRISAPVAGFGSTVAAGLVLWATANSRPPCAPRWPPTPADPPTG